MSIYRRNKNIFILKTYIKHFTIFSIPKNSLKGLHLERKTELIKYSNDNNGIISNTKKLIELACVDAINFDVVRVARNVCKSANPFSSREKADSIFHFIKSRVSYQNDPLNAELYQTSQVTLQEGFGDCDDFTLLGIALNIAVGNEARAVLIDANNDGFFDHIYYEVNTENGWRAYDASYPPSYAGWQPERQHKRTTIDFNKLLNVGGFFDDLIEDIFDFFNKFEKHVIRRPIKEIKRFTEKNFPIIYEPISDFFRVLRDLKRKIFEKLAKILDDIAGSLPVIGGLVKTIIKAAIAITVSAVFGALVSQLLSIQAPLQGQAFQTIAIKPLVIEQATFFKLTTDDKSPLKMSPEEWATLVSIALSIASFGAASMGSLAAVATLEIAQTAQGAINVINSIKAKKEALAQIKATKAEVLIQKQAQLELILKLEHDIELLEAFNELQNELLAEVEDFKASTAKEVREFEELQRIESKKRIDFHKNDLIERRKDILKMMSEVSKNVA